MSDDELATVETFANEIVLQNASVETRLMAVDDAIEAGAMALFGEKYGEEVRVVSMGTALHGDKKGKPYSSGALRRNAREADRRYWPCDAGFQKGLLLPVSAGSKR